MPDKFVLKCNHDSGSTYLVNKTEKTISIKKGIDSLSPKIRSIDQNEEGNLLIGTRGGEIIEIENETPKILLRGHWDKELWGLCVHPSDDVFYTVGEDKLLSLWDVKTMKLKKYVVIDEEATTIDISPNGTNFSLQ